MSIIENILLVLMGSFIAFVLYNSTNFLVAIKTRAQRSKKENSLVNRGLVKSLILKVFTTVPVSAVLFYMLSPLLLKYLPYEIPPSTFYVLLGVASYHFSLQALKMLIRTFATKGLNGFIKEQNTTNEAASVTQLEQINDDDEDSEDPPTEIKRDTEA